MAGRAHPPFPPRTCPTRTSLRLIRNWPQLSVRQPARFDLWRREGGERACEANVRRPTRLRLLSVVIPPAEKKQQQTWREETPTAPNTPLRRNGLRRWCPGGRRGKRFHSFQRWTSGTSCIVHRSSRICTASAWAGATLAAWVSASTGRPASWPRKTQRSQPLTLTLTSFRVLPIGLIHSLCFIWDSAFLTLVLSLISCPF